MRKDIELHISTYDTPIEAQNTYKLRDFQWTVNTSGLSRYIYGEIEVPSVITEASIRNNGVYFSIPYTPYYKEFMVRIKRVYENGAYTCVQNLDSGGEWFVVKTGLYGGNLENACASQLIQISDDDFYAKIGTDCLELYSANQSDFNIVSADRQNANCLIACNPSNNYRYPLTGVGLIQWVNSSHINSGELATILQNQFSDDGVTVTNAAYDYDTQSITQLQLNTSNAD